MRFDTQIADMLIEFLCCTFKPFVSKLTRAQDTLSAGKAATARSMEAITLLCRKHEARSMMFRIVKYSSISFNTT